jgi:hypothetical protein
MASSARKPRPVVSRHRLSRIGGGLWLGATILTIAPADDAPGPPPGVRAQQLAALLDESKQGTDPSRELTAEERTKIQAGRATLPARLLELAEANSKDAVALEALIQVVALVNGSAFPKGGKESVDERALALLLRDHLRSDKLGIVCQQILFGFHKNHEMFLRSVLEANPHRQVQALACLSLAQLLIDRLNRLEVMANQPASIERYHSVFGKEFVQELQRQNRAAVIAEAERLFDRAAREFSDVQIPVTFFGSGGTVGEKAKAELFQIRSLAVGKVAPEIEGEDQDGKRFKLSDYRGKVVLLDFWHHL